jgi:sulfocyanin
MKRFVIISVISLALTACGGGEKADSTPASEAPAATTEPVAADAPMTMPDWFHVDHDAKTVHMTITAGATDANNHWNFNGATKGSMTVTVPVGYTVTIDLVNDDPVMAHSLGISTETSSFTMLDPTPAFAGAMTENPTSMIDGTMPGDTDTIEFVAATAGEYSMACVIPGHAMTGMWIYFNVSADGEAGVQGGA